MRHPGWEFYEVYEHYQVRARELDPAVGNALAARDWRFRTFFGLCGPQSNTKLLDIGCGDGKFLALAREKGFDVYGVDLDARAVELAKTLRGLQNVAAGEWDVAINSKGWKDFDSVTLFDVLEHLDSPVEMVKSIYSLLRPGGKICISVPRLDRLPRVFDAEADIPPHHLTLWTEKALTLLLSVGGFSDICVVKKPLLAGDFLLHAVWRGRRALRRFRSNSSTTKSDGEGLQIAGEVAQRSWRLRTTRSVLRLCEPVHWLLRVSHVGRGFTLMACASKSNS